ncbi:ABC transporter ATP-binding protein [Hahella sp. SMD15-11]|uniref:ABC transporter ATP-binding protein n=1 Tax=Thermohahella caldifontis TaxID=3142973 RepID=A0AB39UYW6_9GAMM
MIEVENLHVRFGAGTPLEVHALRGISLVIPRHQFVTVIGSNGAGKSTLLNALSGDAPVEQGRIRMGNHDVTHLPSFRRTGQVARVFQDPKAGTCENLTIEENLALAARRGQKRGLSRAVRSELTEQFRESLARLGLGLEKRLGEKMGQLSGGQRQAVSLVMATLRPLDILLLDEHTAALDPRTAAFVLELTDRIVEEKKLTVLMVTHSMKQALEHGDRTLMLHEGRIAFDISGEARKQLTVKDLLDQFERQRGQQIEDDSLLLG